jgi:hypothetical protein
VARQLPAAQIRQFDSPVLRVRYRGGVVIGPAGLPEWDLLARAVVELPEPEAGLTVDEIRVLDVLTANRVMLNAGDPLWGRASDDGALTPPGWVWAHRFATRQVALLPAEVYGAFRHVGGVATLTVPTAGYGIDVDDAKPVPTDFREELTEELMDKVENHLGNRLSSAYRAFLQRTNGATPTKPGIHPGFGFVVDQPFFGLARGDRHQDLVYANQWFGDRLTSDFLAIGYVQGGGLAVKVGGADAGSVWYWDDDDHRDDDSYDADHLCAHLLYRCADGFDAFLRSLSVPPRRLLRLVDGRVTGGGSRSVRVPDMGASLPRALRPPAAVG